MSPALDHLAVPAKHFGRSTAARCYLLSKTVAPDELITIIAIARCSLEKPRHRERLAPYELGDLTHTSLHAIKNPPKSRRIV